MTTIIEVIRACNGCGLELRKATKEECERAANGVELPDVRTECPHCRKEFPRPERRRVTISAPGDADDPNCQFRIINRETGEIVEGRWAGVFDWLSHQVADDLIDTSRLAIERIRKGAA